MKDTNFDSKKIIIEVGDAISFIQDLGFTIKISEGSLSPYLENTWVVTATITRASDNNNIVAQGVSMGSGNRLMARSLAIFEALESLYFFALAKPESIKELTGFHSSYYLNADSVFVPVYDSRLDSVNSTNITKSTGWALGSDIESACRRASYEIIEHNIIEKLEKFSAAMFPVNIESLVFGSVLIQISKEKDLQLQTLIIPLNNKQTFALCVIHDTKNNKTFLGTVVGEDDVSNLIKKSFEEVLMGFYFSYIAGDEKVGLPTKDFDYSSFKKLYDSLEREEMDPTLVKKHITSDLLINALSSDFTFRVFLVQNNNIATGLYVAQALTE